MDVTILVVDDSKLARIVAGKAVTALQPGWERIEAGNADEAIRLFETRRIDVALLDFNMPGRDGLALAGELRERSTNLPIAIVTANVQDEVIARARALNAAFVPKPVTAEGLRPFLSGAALRLRTADA